MHHRTTSEHLLPEGRNVRHCILGASTDSSTAAPATPSSTQLEPQHPRILVTFSNQQRGLPGPAGTTGLRYNGDGYLIAQSAHQTALRVAATYSLRLVATWPIKQLAAYCVVYEILDARSASDVLRALAKDSRVVLAQPLQQFHTLSDSRQRGTTVWAARRVMAMPGGPGRRSFPLERAEGIRVPSGRPGAR